MNLTNDYEYFNNEGELEVFEVLVSALTDELNQIINWYKSSKPRPSNYENKKLLLKVLLNSKTQSQLDANDKVYKIGQKLGSNVSENLKISNQLISKIVVGLIDSTEKCVENFEWLKQKNAANDPDVLLLENDEQTNPNANFNSTFITPPTSSINSGTTRESFVEEWLNNSGPREMEDEPELPSSIADHDNTANRNEPNVKTEKQTFNHSNAPKRRNRINGIVFIKPKKKPKYCKICGFKSKSAAYDKVHQRYHTEPQKNNIYKCFICNFSTASRLHMLAHEKSHADGNHLASSRSLEENQTAQLIRS